MEIYLQTKEEKQVYFSKMQKRLKQEVLLATKYLNFGVKIIRVQCYTLEILPFLEQQFSFVLDDEAKYFDETIMVWKEENFSSCMVSLSDALNPLKNIRLRVEKVCNNRKYPSVSVFHGKDLVLFGDASNQVIELYDDACHVCYYGVSNFNPEELIKQGHLFIQVLNKFLKRKDLNLTHGAVLGLDNQGVLLCARGQRGKSTLAVHALINGFDYVSDDYQILKQDADGLYAYPIYSIITLSPYMYTKMYNCFEGKFCCNNARKDKYVFDISKYHSQFRVHYPIRLALFPEIVNHTAPSIEVCSIQDRERAIVQLIHSTVMQMRDLNNHEVIQKLFNMVSSLPFYKINLCADISKNTECLRNFLEMRSFVPPAREVLKGVLVDITFDLATFLDVETYTLYSMNKFATDVYINLSGGFSEEEIWTHLEELQQKNEKLQEAFQLFVSILRQKNFVRKKCFVGNIPNLNATYAAECGYKLSVLEFAESKTIELINIK